MDTSGIAALLQRTVAYQGERITVQTLEEELNVERSRQNAQVETLAELRQHNEVLQGALAQELTQLRVLGEAVARGESAARGEEEASFWQRLKARLGLGAREPIVRHSVEDLLRQQYEASVRRVREASEFADRLQVAEQELYDEIERLNGRIIDAARNEELAAAFVLELQAAREPLEAQLVGEESAELRERQRELDRLKRILSEHSTLLQLYHTAETRLDRLKHSTAQLAETIAALRSDITQYVMAAGEKLDLVATQIRAIGTAADAGVVMHEMKRSLDAMTEALNQSTRFVSETQSFFRQNLDTLLGDLDVFDAETRDTLEHNLALSRAAEEERIRRGLEVALWKKVEEEAEVGLGS